MLQTMLKHLTDFSPKWPHKIVHFNPNEPNNQLTDVYDLLTGSVWEIEYLSHLKNALNTVKHQLDDKDLCEWSQHTSLTDASAWIKQEIQIKIRPAPELLTRAWIKMHEILSSFPIIPETGAIRALFLCEAPGAFVSAVNHFVHNRKRRVEVNPEDGSSSFNWMANSLSPYHDCSNDRSKAIADDSLIRFTLKNWFFGDDETGNVMSPSFLPSLKQRIRDDGKYDLVTADGGTCFIDDPGNQERGSLALLLAESIAAFHALGSGGCFLLKTFSLLEPQSLCLVYLLWSSFENVSIFKPVASKSGNNELYIVCRNFFPESPAAVAMMQLETHLGSSDQFVKDIQKFALLSLNRISLKFLIAYESAISLFSHWQKEAIETNLKLYRSMNSACKKEVTGVKKHRARVYLKKFPLHPILPDQRLVTSLIPVQTRETNDDPSAVR